MNSKRLMFATAAAVLAMASAPANAALTVLASYVGSYGLSTDGGGNSSGSYTVSAFVPLGATVTAAYLYQSNNSTTSVQPVSLNGTSLTFTNLGTTPVGTLTAGRADVTSLVSAIINGGVGGTYNFDVTEGSSGNTDGTALAVIYSLASLPSTTVALLDGFSAQSGETTTVNFATPLIPSAPGFVADLRLGIGFSALGQRSTVRINGTTITTNAGNYDDGADLANGSLITVGGNDDPYSTLLPSYEADRERYDLTPYIVPNSSSIVIDTINASGDDNIFFAGLRISGSAGVNEPAPAVPEPATWAMMIGGGGLTGGALRRRRGLKTIATA